MGLTAAQDIRTDVIYLDDWLVRMEAELACGQVILFMDVDGWQRVGVVVGADGRDPSVSPHPEADPSLTWWLEQTHIAARLARSATAYFAGQRRRS